MVEMMQACNICQELMLAQVESFDPRYQALVSSRENIIFETEDFVVLPSLGPLNDSHVMIVPKNHVNNFAGLQPTKLKQVELIESILSSHIAVALGKKLVFFESGAGELSSHSGGCIVHAHIHCVYESQEFECRLFEEVELKSGGKSLYEGADSDLGYVWYRSSNGKAYICNDPQLPSQFLRYVYSIAAGDVRFWNWRRHNNFDGVLRVIDNYKGISRGKLEFFPITPE